MSKPTKVKFYTKRVTIKARRTRKAKRLPPPPAAIGNTLEYRLCEILQRHCGQRGHNEGAEDTLLRIIWERDRALEVLALDRLKQCGRTEVFAPLPLGA